MSRFPACPNCGCDIAAHGDITLIGWAPPIPQAEPTHSADLILECEQCEAQFNAFVPLGNFVLIEVAQ